MSKLQKLFNEVEAIINTALTKPEDQDRAPPPIKSNDDEVVERIYSLVLNKLNSGEPISDNLKPTTIHSTCKVCNQQRTDHLIAGIKEAYLDFAGKFSEERFRNHLTCRRCGISFGLKETKLMDAREQWVKLVGTATRERDIADNAGKQTADAYNRMYAFSTDDGKTKRG